MSSPISPRVSEQETAMHRFVHPSTQIFWATVILITGAGISAIFWKMPVPTNEMHALYHEGVVNQDLAMMSLPNESASMLSDEERKSMDLPAFDSPPVADDGAERYAQVYPAPPALAMANAEQNKGTVLPEEKEEELFTPVTPQKMEPMRQIIDEKPISVEPVNRDFPPKPMSVNAAVERSDELIAVFHFVENSRADLDAPAEQLADPFPMAAVSAPSLQPLQPLELSTLAPLIPLEMAIPPLPVLVRQ